MSQFFSDLFTLTTLSVAGGAAVLGGVTFSSDEGQDTRQLAATTPELSAPVRDAVVEPVVQTPAPVEVAQIPEAKLLQVSFTSTEDDLFPQRSQARNAKLGLVTGTSVNLRTGPGTGFAVAGRAVRDQQLEVTGQNDGIWVEVYMDGLSDPVWIHGKYFRSP